MDAMDENLRSASPGCGRKNRWPKCFAVKTDHPESYFSSLICIFHGILRNARFRVRKFQPCRNSQQQSTAKTNQTPQKPLAIALVKAELQFFRCSVPTIDIPVNLTLLKLQIHGIFRNSSLTIPAAARPQKATHFPHSTKANAPNGSQDASVVSEYKKAPLVNNINKLGNSSFKSF